MKSEALRNVRTMRQVTTGLDLARKQKARTTNDLSKTPAEIEELGHLTDRRLQQVLEKEKRRFSLQEARVSRSQQRILIARVKLAMTVNKNRALTELRLELQRARWKGSPAAAAKAKIPAPEGRLRRVEMKY